MFLRPRSGRPVPHFDPFERQIRSVFGWKSVVWVRKCCPLRPAEGVLMVLSGVPVSLAELVASAEREPGSAERAGWRR